MSVDMQTSCKRDLHVKTASVHGFYMHRPDIDGWSSVYSSMLCYISKSEASNAIPIHYVVCIACRFLPRLQRECLSQQHLDCVHTVMHDYIWIRVIICQGNG